MQRHRTLVLATLLLGGAALPRLGAQSPVAPADVATLRPGDMLRITVWENPAMSGEFEVAPDGTLRHPIYNRLRVGGVPVDGVRGEVDAFVRKFQRDPQVEVEPLLKVMVSGNVRAPNIYSLPPETTLADAVARAGGAAEGGRLDRVSLLRGGRELRVDLSRGADEAPPTIRSGDQIVVPARRNLLRDYIGPLASVSATIFSIISISRR
jgi:polysaccharide export outer membrane protein